MGATLVQQLTGNFGLLVIFWLGGLTAVLAAEQTVNQTAAQVCAPAASSWASHWPETELHLIGAELSPLASVCCTAAEQHPCEQASSQTHLTDAACLPGYACWRWETAAQA